MIVKLRRELTCSFMAYYLHSSIDVGMRASMIICSLNAGAWTLKWILKKRNIQIFSIWC